MRQMSGHQACQPQLAQTIPRGMHTTWATSTPSKPSPKKQLRSLVEDMKEVNTRSQRPAKATVPHHSSSPTASASQVHSTTSQQVQQSQQQQHKAGTATQQHTRNGIPAVPEDRGASTSGRGDILQELQLEKVLKMRQSRGGHQMALLDASKVKLYPPVKKGPLELPGGPNWQALRRHIRYEATAGLPDVKAIVIVEGRNDHSALSRAVNAPVYVCGGNRVGREHVEDDIRVLPRLGLDVVVLTDPDSSGRIFRAKLDDMIGPLYHAFLPEHLAVTHTGTSTKQAGNLGVEHAEAAAIRQALSTAVLSFGVGRQVFSREHLVQLQLINDLQRPQVSNVELRRRRLCALLGVGDCDGSQLVSVLNRYFSEEQLQDALQVVDQQLAADGIVVGGEKHAKRSRA